MEQVQQMEGHTDDVNCVAWHPTNSDLLCTGSEDGTARVWSISTGQEVMQLKGHTCSVNCVAWHPTNSDLLCTGSFDGTAKVWRVHGQVTTHPLLLALA